MVQPRLWTGIAMLMRLVRLAPLMIIKMAGSADRRRIIRSLYGWAMIHQENLILWSAALIRLISGRKRWKNIFLTNLQKSLIQVIMLILATTIVMIAMAAKSICLDDRMMKFCQMDIQLVITEKIVRRQLRLKTLFPR